MDGPIFDNEGKQVANRIGNKVWSNDRSKVYDVDAVGNLLDKQTGKILGHLIPAGAFLPNGTPAPTQNLF